METQVVIEERMERKKLLITASTFPRNNHDTEPRFILDIAKSLNRYYQVTVLAPAAPGALDEEYMENVHVIRYHYFPVHSLETLCYPGAIVPRIKEKKARGLLVPCLFLALFFQLLKNRKNYDFFYANWLIPQGIIQSFVKTPYLVTGHGGDVTSLNKGVFRTLKKRCIKRAAAVTAVSEPLMQVVNDLYSNPHQAVISMGCDIHQFGKQHYREEYYQQQGRPVVLYVGRLAEKKGVRYLIDAMQYLDRDEQGELPIRLAIIGDGTLRAELEQQAQPYGEDISFIGAKTHKELKEAYASADLFVMPSVTASDGDQEGFGLVLLEAFASGLPVIASNSGGIPDVVKDGYNGLLVEERDSKGIAAAINRLLSDPDLYHIIRKNALKFAEQYDYSVIGDRYHDLIESVMDHE